MRRRRRKRRNRKDYRLIEVRLAPYGMEISKERCGKFKERCRKCFSVNTCNTVLYTSTNSTTLALVTLLRLG